MYSYIAKSVFNDQLGSSTDPCYIQNRVITNRAIKRLRYTHKIDFYEDLTKIIFQLSSNIINTHLISSCALCENLF